MHIAACAGSLYVAGSLRLDEVELARVEASAHMSFRVTAAEARTLGVELLAAAAAVEAARSTVDRPEAAPAGR